jgi:hypothetical protein
MELIIAFIKLWLLIVIIIIAFIAIIAALHVDDIRKTWDAVQKEEKDMENEID